MAKQVRDAMANLLMSNKFDCIFTATFKRRENHAQGAIERVERAIYSPKWKPVKSFIASEQFKLGGYHCHGLLDYGSKLPVAKVDRISKTVARQLQDLGYSKASVIRSSEASSLYCAKYVTKMEDGREGDYKILGRGKFWNG